MMNSTSVPHWMYRKLIKVLKKIRVINAYKYLFNSVFFRTLAFNSRVRFYACGTMFVSKDDNRGLALLKKGGVTQPLVTYTWRQLIDASSPDIVLDIGANYGEILLSAVYPEKSRVYAFEFNANLCLLLRKSVGSHKNVNSISIVNKAVSDSEGKISATIDKKWSGTSSAVGRIEAGHKTYKGKGPEQFEEVTVESVTVDNFIEANHSGPRANIVFKIDVEGFDGRVLYGMKRLFDSSDNFCGIVEFDAEYLGKAGTPPEDVFGYMKSIGHMFRLDKRMGVVPLDKFDQLRAHDNVLLCSDSSLGSKLDIPIVLR